VGDKVLKGFTTFVKKSVPNISCFARFGGDEFVMIMVNIESEQAKAHIEQLRQEVAETSFVSEHQVSTSISVGMATLTPLDADIDALIARADVKLYEAKKTRNAVVS